MRKFKYLLVVGLVAFVAACGTMTQEETVISTCDGLREVIEVVDINIQKDTIDIKAGKDARFETDDLRSITDAKDIILKVCLDDNLTAADVTARVSDSIVVLMLARGGIK